MTAEDLVHDIEHLAGFHLGAVHLHHERLGACVGLVLLGKDLDSASFWPLDVTGVQRLCITYLAFGYDLMEVELDLAEEVVL